MKNKAFKNGLAIIILITMVLVSLLGIIHYGIKTWPPQVWIGLYIGLITSLPVLAFELPFMEYSVLDTIKTSYWVCFFGPFSMMPLVYFMIIGSNFITSVGLIVGFLGILIISFLLNVVLHYRRSLRYY